MLQMSRFALIAACALTTSCATLSEEECKTVNWQDLGERDGVAGYRKGRVGDHVRSCAEHDILVDQAAYAEGWQRGIPRFCTAQNGYDRGIAGDAYFDSCPAEIALPFENAYEPSRRVYDAEQEVESIARKIDETEAELISLRGSQDAAQQQRATDLSRDLLTQKSDLRAAEREESRARDALLLYLARNPGIRSR